MAAPTKKWHEVLAMCACAGDLSHMGQKELMNYRKDAKIREEL
eukprot:gene34431-37937_t